MTSHVIKRLNFITGVFSCKITIWVKHFSAPQAEPVDFFQYYKPAFLFKILFKLIKSNFSVNFFNLDFSIKNIEKEFCNIFYI